MDKFRLDGKTALITGGSKGIGLAIAKAFAHRGAEIVLVSRGIPSVILLRSSMRDEDFENYLDKFFEEIGDGRKLILGISDTTPPAADFQRILRIGEKAASFVVK